MKKKNMTIILATVAVAFNLALIAISGSLLSAIFNILIVLLACWLGLKGGE